MNAAARMVAAVDEVVAAAVDVSADSEEPTASSSAAAAAAAERALPVPAATKAAAAVTVPSPLFPVSPSLEGIAAEEHENALEVARDEAAYSEIRRHKKEVRFARLRNAELRGVDARLDARGLQHQPHQPFEQPDVEELTEVRDYVADLQDSYSDAVEAAGFIYSPGKRQFADTPIKHIRSLMRGNMVSVPDNGADAIKEWHEVYDSEPHYW